MNLANLSTIKSILSQYHIRPNKFLGQYFLRDPVVLEEIIGAAEISQNDKILEIGPGLGVLTLELARRAQKVVAVEKDKKLAEVLEDILRKEEIKNAEVIVDDILKLKNTRYQIPDTKYKIVANLPYYLTARLIRKLLELPNPPTEMILMLQKEVAERICASPLRLRPTFAQGYGRAKQGYGGQAKMNLLAVSVQFYGEPQIIAFVSRKSFWPEPEVDSAILKIKVFAKKKKEIDAKRFFTVVRAGFISPRKKLANNLTGVLREKNRQIIEKSLKKIGLKPDCRAQNLSVDNWQKLVSLIGKNIV